MAPLMQKTRKTQIVYGRERRHRNATLDEIHLSLPISPCPEKPPTQGEEMNTTRYMLRVLFKWLVCGVVLIQDRGASAKEPGTSASNAGTYRLPSLSTRRDNLQATLDDTMALEQCLACRQTLPPSRQRLWLSEALRCAGTRFARRESYWAVPAAK